MCRSFRRARIPNSGHTLTRISHRIRCIGARETEKVVLQPRLFQNSPEVSMPIECNPEFFEFPTFEGRPVVAAFDGGAINLDAGALLLGQTDRAIRLPDPPPAP
jgi:hypothetical protein